VGGNFVYSGPVTLGGKGITQRTAKREGQKEGKKTPISLLLQSLEKKEGGVLVPGGHLSRRIKTYLIIRTKDVREQENSNANYWERGVGKK